MRHHTPLAVALVAATIGTAICGIDFSQNTPNPFQGQNLPPDGQSVDDFPVQVYALVEDLYRVDEQVYTFSIVFSLLFQYNDSATAEYVMNDDASSCSFYCASDPTVTLNNDGVPACCDRAFIPAVQAVNLISFEGQEVPADYQLSVLSNETVAYYSRTRGTFSVDLEYRSYPFDKHFLAVDFKTPFLPLDSGGTFVERVDAKLTFGNSANSGYKDAYRPSVTAIDLPAWKVVYTHFEVMNFTTAYARGGTNARKTENDVTLSELSGHGFRLSLEVERQDKAFYIIVEIVPICLIVAFSFACFTLPIANVKARFNVLAGQFLTLIVLQFILYTVLPATYQVIKPYLLICVSYIMTFLMCGEVVTASWLHHQYKRNLTRRAQRHSRAAYKAWKHRVLNGDVPMMPTMVPKTQKAPKVANGDAVESGTYDSTDEYSSDNAEEGRHQPNNVHARRLAYSQKDHKRLKRLRGSRLFRIRFLREIVLIWCFMGRPDSQVFCQYVAKVFDRVCCSLLALAYLVCVVVMFALASREANAAADYN